MTVKLSGSGGTSVISSDARIGLDLDRRVQEAARLESNGRLDEAESILRRLLGNHPRHHPAWNALAILAFRRGDLPGAVEATEKALEIDAKQSLYWRNLCEMRRRKGDLVGAIDAGRRAVRLAPTDPEALFNLALAQNDAAEFDLAITNLRRLLQFAPEHGRGWNNLGHALLAKGLVLEARDACERAVRIDATNAEAFYNLGIIERRLDDAGGAARHFERALSLRPDFAQARDQLGEMTATGAQAPESPDEWNSLGITHWSDGRYEEALAAYEAALALNPNFLPSIANAATCLADLGRIRDAADLARRGLAIDPTVSSIRLVLGHCQLELGDWEEGWRNYEARFSGAHEVQTGRTTYADFPIPRWNGEAGTENLSILVVIEQGYGDVIQFSRYLDLLLERFARVGLACSAPLLRLMEWSYGERVAMLPHMPGGFENWDRVIALMSLPLVFGTTLATVPATVPYLRVPAVERLLWKERIDRVLPGGRRIGLAWAGRREHRHNARRSIAFEELSPLFDLADVTWTDLQRREGDEPPPSVPIGTRWIDWTDEFYDFATTASVIAGLDLVICVDTAIAHLAGSLGVPVWMLDRYDSEWRWMAPRTDSPWYPTMRIFHQTTRGDWRGVVERVVEALKG